MISSSHPQFDSINKESKKQVACRIVVGVCILGCCIFAVIAAVVLAAVFFPRSPNIVSQQLYFTQFSVDFCPAQSKSNNSACCVGSSCTFSYNNATLGIASYFVVRATNGNLFNISLNAVKIEIMYGSEVIGSSASESYPVGPQTTQDVNVPIIWKSSLSSNVMKSIMCQLTGNNNALPYTFTLSMGSVTYFLNTFAFSSQTASLQASIDVCSSNCKVQYYSSMCPT
ncbi:predicted protein [Naegleria gruberi]|uniref:Predicted protein n=1 Tax=Naegleria gruberi TaxID=5762 RepID=D2VVU4_NAEGR|nr:uncharacterized protein NAEGRDRAFT_73143 [Naegleria gruberi]EFC39102.1 predicted protein [Naegleria gruberi]|eukprot:XP_002671846.1 predicted protein [Naegleria gruberi strain NEG-M]